MKRNIRENGIICGTSISDARKEKTIEYFSRCVRQGRFPKIFHGLLQITYIIKTEI